MLEKLNIQLRTPTPVVERPSSRSSIYCPETPANIKQLLKHKTSARRLLKYRSDSPPTPTKDIIDQAYKVCEQVMKGMLLLEQEVKDLRLKTIRRSERSHYLRNR